MITSLYFTPGNCHIVFKWLVQGHMIHGVERLDLNLGSLDSSFLP